MKSTCNANASLFDANASLFDANAFQMQCKCNTNAFVIFHIIANASKYNANASYFYANALLLQDIKEIYIISLYIPFHYIYRERGKIPFRPQNRYKFQRFGIFSRIICMVRGFVVLLQCSTHLKGGREPQTINIAVFFILHCKTYRHRTPVEICNGNPAFEVLNDGIGDAVTIALNFHKSFNNERSNQNF